MGSKLRRYSHASSMGGDGARGGSQFLGHFLLGILTIGRLVIRREILCQGRYCGAIFMELSISDNTLFITGTTSMLALALLLLVLHHHHDDC